MPLSEDDKKWLEERIEDLIDRRLVRPGEYVGRGDGRIPNYSLYDNRVWNLEVLVHKLTATAETDFRQRLKKAILQWVSLLSRS